MKKSSTQQSLRGHSSSGTRKPNQHSESNVRLPQTTVPNLAQTWTQPAIPLKPGHASAQSHQQLPQQQQQTPIESEFEANLNMKKFFGTAPKYRNANQLQQSAASNNEQLQTVHQKFWQDLSKTDKSLMRLEQGRPRPLTATKPLSRAFSMPKFKNGLQFSNGTEAAAAGEEEMEIYEGGVHANTIESAVQNLNSEVNFQRIVNIHRQPFQFLSHVGGKFTSLKAISSEEAAANLAKESYPKRVLPVQQMNQYEQLEMFKKIDIERNILDQISKLAKVPHVIRPQTSHTSASSTKGSQQNLQTKSSKQLPLTSSQQTITLLQSASKPNLPRTVSGSTISRELPSVQKPTAPQSAKLQRVVSGKPVKSGSALRIQSAKPEIMRRLQEKNKAILEDMNQMDYDQELGIQEDLGADDEFYRRAETAKNHVRPKSSISQSGKRILSGKSVGAESYFKEFRKFTQVNAAEIPYEELFDRNERTITATFAKFGDLGYYAPVSRIGSYMQYSAKLKMEHLHEIISLQLTSTNIEKAEFDIPMQLAIIDELNPFQKKASTGISTTFTAEEVKREPISLALFPEYFPENDDAKTPQDSSNELFNRMLDEMGGETYDPANLGRSNYLFIEPESWPENIRKLVENSVARYQHYLYSDIIKPDEIPKFRKIWMVNAFSLIPKHLLKNEVTSRQVRICFNIFGRVFQEIFESFKIAMKTVMIDYVLRSPQERARLHITLIPRRVLCSGERISREGGFNVNLFHNWHRFVNVGREFCKSNLVKMNIINSSLQHWFFEFSALRLFEFETSKRISTLGHSLNIQQFNRMQSLYRTNVVSLFKCIWHRGAISIIKKFKYLRRSDNSSGGRWTLGGFQAHVRESHLKSQLSYKLSGKHFPQEQIEEIVEEAQLEDDDSQSIQQFRQSPGKRGHFHAENSEIEEEHEDDLAEGNAGSHFYDDEGGVTVDDIDESLAFLIDADDEKGQSSEQVYFSVLKYLTQRGEKGSSSSSSSPSFDFFEDIAFRDLKDIRSTETYRKLAAKAKEDESTWATSSGWSLYTKEYKQRILDNVGMMMSLQLRSIIESSFEYFENSITSIPTYRKWKAHSAYKVERTGGSFDEMDEGLFDKSQDQFDEDEAEDGIAENSLTISKKPDGQLLRQGSKQLERVDSTQQKNSLRRIPSNQAIAQVAGSAARPQSSSRSKSQIQGSLSHIPQIDIGAAAGQGGVGGSIQAKTLLNLIPKDSTIGIKLPFVMKDQDNLFPILTLSLVLEDETIKFKETAETIQQEMKKLMNDIVTAFDSFLHPRTSQIKDEKLSNSTPKDNNNNNANHYANAEHFQRGLFAKSSENQLNIGNNAFSRLTDEDLDGNCQGKYEQFYSKIGAFVQVKEKQIKIGGGAGNSTQANGDTTETAKESGANGEDLTNRILTSLVQPGAKKKKFLNIANFNEGCFQTVLNRVNAHLVKHFEESAIAISVFDQFKHFTEKQADKEIKALTAKKGNITNEEFRSYYEVLDKFENLANQIPLKVKFTLFDVDCSQVRMAILKQIHDLQQRLITTFEEAILTNLRSITDRYSKIASFVRKSTSTADEVEEMEKFLDDLTSDRIQIKQRSNLCFQKITFLMKLNVKGNVSISELTKDVYEWPEKLDKELISQEEKHSMERQRIEEKLKEKRGVFENRVGVYLEDLKEFEKFTEYYRYKEYMSEITDFEKVLSEARDLMEDINDQEQKLFGISSQFEKFTKLNMEFEPYSKLWRAITVFSENKKKWMSDSVSTLDSAECEAIVKEHYKLSSKLLNAFRPDSIPSSISHKFKDEVQQIQSYLPTIEIISRPGIQQRHWARIQNVMRIPEEEFSTEKISLKYLLAKGIEERIAEVEEISEGASKEYALENALDKMEKEWDNLNFSVINWKNRDVLILQGSAVEDIQILLDDHTLKAQTIRANPNIKFAEQRAIRWEKLMLFIQSVLENWIKVQTFYLYLEPIFSSEDISKTLVTETDKFHKVDKIWKSTMEIVQNDPKVLNIERIPNIDHDFVNCLRLIEEIQKGLEEHLESKRLDFPRFFFLSNDDLLNILAETRDPLLVQPHMKKCFEGISELLFNYNVDITGMRSSEKEEVVFLERIAPRNFKSNVEKWLVEVEKQMRVSLAKVVEESLLDIQSGQENRTEWVRKWPGQVVLAVSQLIWTDNLETALNTSGLNGLKKFYESCNSGLEEIVTLVRQNLSSLETITLGALIVIEVHNKDVVKRLVDEGISHTQQFEWLSEMRYYWDQSTSLLDVKMMSTSMKYGYEYLGNTGRLVITPLTDRCYRTLMNALQLNLGGAPEGPAGTGKTESTKDLAKAMAMQCIVFNCSDGLNIHAMAKFFKGLISTGAWSCFDEFNRIDVEVLSVIAQQILQIQQSKAQNLATIHFEGTELTLRNSCNVFITMNPGYAGRSELPDNLKALFRPVAMMVPDYSLIAEISLYSFGFVDARSQARKIVAVYKLCSEQLSSQDHYDYGMRAVKAVLTAASQLKRKYPNEREEVLVLRSITDVNLPKFLQQDVDLFKNITSDLFPGVKLPSPDYTVLNTAMTAVLSQMNLQSVLNFRRKVLQLYEVVNTRHGLMLVGQPFAGKSTCYKVLAATLTYASKKLGSAEELPTNYYILNPKSISLNQLYGYSDPVSKEWTEGILAEVYRKCATSTAPDRQFIVFDGPVDADWIENMNTVLDDNKKLCLMSGETIPMSNTMTMMFEVADLKQASPATVSRCGMVYMQPEQLGWWPLVLSWLSTMTEQIDGQLLDRISELFDGIVGQSVSFIKSRCKEYQNVPEGTLVVSLMRLLKSLMQRQRFFDRDFISKIKLENLMNGLDMIFLYSLVWSVCATIDEKGRADVDRYVKSMIKNPIKCESKKDKLIKFEKPSMLPDNGPSVLIYDYYVEMEDNSAFRWKSYASRVEYLASTEVIPSDSTYQNIVIKTTESLRITEQLETSILARMPFLLIGPTGTGKSTYINTYLKSLSPTAFLMIPVNFSAQTSSEQTQFIVDSKLDKRRKGIFGPRLGVHCLVFVDDLNMPQLDKYGAQPPIELLRQLLDQKGWYGSDRKFMEIIDTSLVAAMGPPGGGRNQITSRLLRHFNVISAIEPNAAQMEKIFTELMDWYMVKIQLNDENIKRVFRFCIDATVEMYGSILSNLKPTPAKSHYLFNMRDVSRVVQGLQLVSKPQITDDKFVIRLWINEVSRVFFDRLSFEADQIWFYNSMVASMRNKIKEDIKNVMKGPYDHVKYNLLTPDPIRVIRFGELLGNTDTDRPYEEMIDSDKIFAKVEYYLEDYNATNKRPMGLVLFDFAVGHIVNICRILRIQGGHGLLIGLGGSGRQSLTYLATHVRELKLTSIEMSKSYERDSWVEDMKKLMTLVGVDGKESVFVINDAHVSKPFVIEDLNNLLNSGDIPNVFSPEDFIPLIDKLRQSAKKEGKTKLLESGTNAQFYDYFVQNIKRKLHIILTQSPIGDTLRNRIRNFPNIVNCTTIVWYKQWPEEALEAVATKIIQDMYLDAGLSRKLVGVCKQMHQSSLELSSEYLRQEKRVNYITPSSYLELLNNLKGLLLSQRQKLEENRNVYSNGVQKLITTAEQVKRMEEELIEKQPILITMNAETQQIAAEIQAQAEAMEPKRIQAEKQESEVNLRVKEAELIKEDCERELSVAKPQLKKAEDALNTLDSNDINKMKAMLKPPETVQLVMEAVCVLCKVPPLPVPNPKYPKERIMSYWEASKKFLSDKHFLTTLIQYDKENIEEAVMRKVREKYISQTKLFNPKRVEQASSAAKGLCEWILALSEYEKVLQIVRPKQQKYNESKQEVAILQMNLKQTRDELATLNKEIARLQQSYDQTRKKQQRLEEDILDCEKKLERASSLIGGLGGEQERWLKTTDQLEQQLLFVVGDVTISTGIISYLGPFSSIYRSISIQISENFSLESTLGEAIVMRKWNLNGLPADAFSRENGIITYRSRRWPLMIDPQLQAFRWIRKNEADSKVTVVKQSDAGFIRTLETSIQFGQCLIIENVKEEIDNVLDPILAKQTFKNAGVLSIKLGDNIIDYSKHFKLFLTSKLRNPHFTPEISTKLTLVNFTITKEGLEDQLLETCSHKYQQQLEDIEKQILEVLNKADNILDDEQGVQVLQQSKQVSNDIIERQQEAKVTEQRLEQSRQEYKPIANHSATLFFAIMDMAAQDFMYQYSLNWFINLYIDAFDKAERQKSSKPTDRVIVVSKYLTYSIYSNVCRSLFEKDKLLFSFLLLLRIQENKKHIDQHELHFLIAPIDGSSEENAMDNPAKSFLPQAIWMKILALSKISTKFKSFPESFAENVEAWRKVYYDSEAHTAKFAGAFSACTPMQRLCILKAIRPDRITLAVQDFIRAELGERFTVAPPFNLPQTFADSNCYQPLIFILPGTDPMNNLINFAESKQKSLKAISLGQGQGIHAERAIEEAQKSGSWVILQNCHLAPSWMPKLERICEDMQNSSMTKDKINVQFRLWLTSYPSADFPISILQNSVKMTNEAPKGVKSNMTVSYLSDTISDAEFFESNPKPQQFKTLLYGLCFFHAVLQERRTFGALGWNIFYDFNQSDLRISARQLHILLAEYDVIPFNALYYMVGECNYGGRVTDDRDRRILHALMQDFFSEALFESKFNFANDPNYTVPTGINTHPEYLKYIDEKLPIHQSPGIFGFHENGVIVRDLKETDDLCSALLLMMGGSAMRSAEGDSENELNTIAQDILAKIPKRFDPELVAAKYPITYDNSLNTVLQQEIIRYNNLSRVIVTSLKDIQNALLGVVVMSSTLEKVCASLLKGLVPDLWKKASYPSLKPLGSYITDLVKRLKYYQNWIDTEIPRCHWISGFYFTQTFLTATLQNYARKYSIPIDALTFEYVFYGEPTSNVEEQAQFIHIEDGSLMHGLYIEGCKWDEASKSLVESDPKVLSVVAPIIWLKPIEVSSAARQQHHYQTQSYACPVYKTAERRGTLSTTGHSTNFIMSIDMPSEMPSSHWVKRGVAMLCQLSD